VSIAAPPVAVNIVFSFRRGERVLLLPAHERWAPQNAVIKNGQAVFFCFVFKYYTLHFKNPKKFSLSEFCWYFCYIFHMVFTSIIIFGEKKMD
jgi:hypothetical protein